MVKKYELLEYIEELAIKNIRLFYIEEIIDRFSLSIEDAINLLADIAKNNEVIEIEYEIKCPCLETIETVKDFRSILGTYIYCYECDKEILVKKSNIYISYIINKEYREHIKNKKKSSLKRKREMKVSLVHSI